MFHSDHQIAILQTFDMWMENCALHAIIIFTFYFHKRVLLLYTICTYVICRRLHKKRTEQMCVKSEPILIPFFHSIYGKSNFPTMNNNNNNNKQLAQVHSNRNSWTTITNVEIQNGANSMNLTMNGAVSLLNRKLVHVLLDFFFFVEQWTLNTYTPNCHSLARKQFTKCCTLPINVFIFNVQISSSIRRNEYIFTHNDFAHPFFCPFFFSFSFFSTFMVQMEILVSLQDPV